jgi:hypothetical protein
MASPFHLHKTPDFPRFPPFPTTKIPCENRDAETPALSPNHSGPANHRICRTHCTSKKQKSSEQARPFKEAERPHYKSDNSIFIRRVSP